MECGGKVRIALKAAVGQEEGVDGADGGMTMSGDEEAIVLECQTQRQTRGKTTRLQSTDIISVFLMSKDIGKFSCFHGKAESGSRVGFKAVIKSTPVQCVKRERLSVAVRT